MEEPERTVLRRMKGQRREHQVGDWFVVQLESDASFRAGRIVKMGEPTREARFPGGILAYLYQPPYADVPAPDPGLRPDQLLIPPFFTHAAMWSKGFFRTVGHEPLRPGDLLVRPCFYSAFHDWYVDDNDRLLDERVEPCGWFSLANPEALADEIDDAVNGRPVVTRFGVRRPG